MIYVHPDNNPANLEYNSCVFLFVRSWYMPALEEFTFADSWLRVPAMETKHGSKSYYSVINSFLDSVCLVKMAECGTVLKVTRGKHGKILKTSIVSDIAKECVDIPAYEIENKKPWPYREMFDQRLIQQRFKQKYGEDSSKFFEESSNISYSAIRKQISPRPCNCGRPKTRD